METALAPGQTIEIKGINGAIAAERAASEMAEVIARKQARRSDPGEVRIEVEESADGVTICAVYPSSDWGFGFVYEFFAALFALPEPAAQGSGCNGHSHVGRNDVRVDFAVKVPEGVRFIGRTVNGEVQALSLGSDVEIRTVNGDVRLSTSGHAEATTVNGSIDASLGTLSKPARFATVNGGITVELPSNLQADLEASTVNGGITTDFPLTVRGSFVGKHLRGAIAGGGPPLELKTVNGSIRLRQRP